MINIVNEREITFIIHLRVDNVERKGNLDITLKYLNETFPDSAIIVIEDDIEKKASYIETKYENVRYIFLKNEGSYIKCKSYNKGLQASFTEFVCFLDIDCIVDKQNIIKGIGALGAQNNSICLGYNGTCIYFKYNIKDIVRGLPAKELINSLNSYIDRKKIITGYETENYTIGNTKAIGGLVMGKRLTFKKYGGFNPNFNGWGYEDNEIIIRLKKLGVEIYKVNTTIPYLFHMPHTQEGERRDRHSFFESNFNEYNKILNMNKDALEKYIDTW
jgi:predicted glycosyltransferase involved in capsule biosynthesis